MRNATLRQFRVFEAAARLMSFSKAARELHLTQPAVSIQIRQLEENAGLPLFEQIGRKIYLTAAGRQMEHYARAVLGLVVEAGEAFAALKGVTGGTLNIAAISAGNYFLPELIARFQARHEGVKVRLLVENREGLLRRLADNETDLAIMGRPPHSEEIVAESFAPHPYVVVAPAGHPLAKQRDIPLRQLQDENWIVREQGSDTRMAMIETFATQRFEPVVAMEVPSNDTIKQAVIAGMGLSFLSAHTVGLELETGRLAILDMHGFPVMRSWHMVHLQKKWLPPVAVAFRKFLQTEGEKAIAAILPLAGQYRSRRRRKRSPGDAL
ncbi:MAG: LysR family transcriptional regulator [Burkholderiales bacterium]